MRTPSIVVLSAALFGASMFSPAVREDVARTLEQAGAMLATTVPTDTVAGTSVPTVPDPATSESIPPTPDAPQTTTPQATTPDRSAPGTARSLRDVYRQSTAAAVRVDVGTSGLGSGFFLTSDGLVLTAAHVALGENVDRLGVTLDDGQRLPARLVGYDETRDVALLKVSGQGFETLPLAASTPRVGDGVVAIGNSRGAFDGGRAGTVTALNVSLDANFPSGMVATSMPLAPGDSGGPVLNDRGEVVGVSTAISERDGQFSSYFVPLTADSRLVADLRAGVRRGVPVIGVGVADARSATGTAGALVTTVTPGLGGERAGLRAAQMREFRGADGDVQQDVGAADVIVGVDGREVRSPADLVAYLRTKAAGDRVTLTVRRDGRSVRVPVTLSARPTT